jgi:hypothetical protein
VSALLLVATGRDPETAFWLLAVLVGQIVYHDTYAPDLPGFQVTLLFNVAQAQARVGAPAKCICCISDKAGRHLQVHDLFDGHVFVVALQVEMRTLAILVKSKLPQLNK